MAKKRAKIFETKYFGPIIGLIIAGIFLLIELKVPVFPINIGTELIKGIELKLLDTNFKLKNALTGTKLQEGVTQVFQNPKISEDILIVGIDSYSLSQYGKWPFPRYRHADLINAFSRIKNQNMRERSVFLDTFFIEPDKRASDDALLLEAIKDSKRVFLESILTTVPNADETQDELWQRQIAMMEAAGSIEKINGPWREMSDFYGIEAPLKPLGIEVKSYGHANFVEDSDQIYRRQRLVAKASVLTDYINYNTMQPGFSVDESKYESLVWVDTNNIPHIIKTPLTQAQIDSLKVQLEKESVQAYEDTDGDGEPDKSYYVLRKYKNYFIPSITLALAADYFHKELSDLEITLGDSIVIKNPEKFNSDTGLWEPYKTVIKPEEQDKDGNIVKEAEYKVLPEIKIPISNQGEMLVNFMGPPSSASSDGYQTFTVRPYAAYADGAPNIDESTWRNTSGVQNKILMVGPFAKGIVEDEKPTPYGLMYGIEIHANALNTIIMNNFIYDAPFWLNAVILLFLVLLIAILTSWLKNIWSFIVPLVVLFLLLLGYLLAVATVFDLTSIVLNYSAPAIGMILSLVSIIAYRAMTEEKDKRRIRDMFGKYVSPSVVDQLMINPPELGGVDKELTVLFSDIRGFTTLSENMSPQELVNHLNVYLTAMTDLIQGYGGTLDKYVGDEVMCFWGAPLPQRDHAILACKCALRQMEVLKELNKDWPESRRINIGIGLNSGIMTVGNMGSPGRMNYTLMGDNVNLGARLEGTNKEYGSNIIISEFTYGLVKDHFIVRELDNIRVKGKNKPVIIYELVDCIGSIEPPELFTKGKHIGAVKE